jgi:hypothetical protein
MAIEEKAYEAVRNIDRNDLVKPGGEKEILKVLNIAYKKDDMVDKLTKAIDFFTIGKEKSESMREFIVRYERVAHECEKVGGGKMSKELMGSRLLHGARLSSVDQHIVLGACSLEGYEYETVKKVLGRVFQEMKDESKGERGELGWLGKTQTEKKCFKCGEGGHFAKDCKSKWKCYKCNEEGHIAKQCGKNKREFKCFICNSKEHGMGECPENWKNKGKVEAEKGETVMWSRFDETCSDSDMGRDAIEGVLDTGCNTTLCGEL